MSILTKVAKGVAFGDVSNQSVRNILTEISKQIGGKFTEQEMYDTLDFFDWKCPYTDKDLRPLIENDLGGYATDHIYPQNKEWCGLNVKGNLVIVDREANAKKHNQDVETFLLNDRDVLGNLDMKTRQGRLEKIKEFQKQCGYDPEKIRGLVSPLMQARYDEIRAQQEMCIQEALVMLETINIHAISNKNVLSTVSKSKGSKSIPEILFYPPDENQFKSELLEKKKARFELTYDTGAKKNSVWKAESFNVSSSLKANIQSRPFWRKKSQEGLVRVEVFIDCLNKGDKADFLDSTEQKMNKIFSENKYALSELEHMLISKKGKEWFELNYEKKCYYLAFVPEEMGQEVCETFWVSQTCSPLVCLKMAYQLGEAQSMPYRILLSDRCTEVDAELLAFALCEK